jgi:hypothetical protein
MNGGTLVERKPPHDLKDITQSVVFEKEYKWTIPKAKKWLKDHGYHSDSVDKKPTQLRFRQYNPEDLPDRHFISKKLKDEGILLIISVPNNSGSGVMINNVEHHTPQEIINSQIKHFAKQFHEQTKAHKKLEKEKESTLLKIKKATKSRVSKDSNAMKEKMAKLRAMRKKK